MNNAVIKIRIDRMIETASAMSSSDRRQRQDQDHEDDEDADREPHVAAPESFTDGSEAGNLKPLVAGRAAEMSVIAYQVCRVRQRTAERRGGGPEPGKDCPVYG